MVRKRTGGAERFRCWIHKTHTKGYSMATLERDGSVDMGKTMFFSEMFRLTSAERDTMVSLIQGGKSFDLADFLGDKLGDAIFY